MATDLLMVKAVTDNLEVSYNETEAKDLNIINVNFRNINFREAHFSNLEDAVMVGPIIRVTMELINISITHMTHRQSSMAHLVVYAVVLIILLSTATKREHDINNIMEKMSINPHQQQQGNLYQ